MFFLFKIILAIVFAATLFILSGGVFFDSPSDKFSSRQSETKVEEALPKAEEVPQETMRAPEVVKTEPLRVIKEEIKTTTSLLTVPGIISWTNFFRQTNGILPLSESANLNLVASNKLQDMFTRQYFEHTSPTGESAGDLAKAVGYKFIIIGENLAMGDFTDDEDVVRAWMNSPGHRANILKNSYTEIGVAAQKGVFNGKEVWLSVQIFAAPFALCKSPEADLLEKIDTQKAQLKSNKEHLDLLRSIIEKEKYQTREEYEKLVAEYNSLVPSYNFLAQSTKSLIEQYNTEVALFNQCVDSIE